MPSAPTSRSASTLRAVAEMRHHRIGRSARSPSAPRRGDSARPETRRAACGRAAPRRSASAGIRPRTTMRPSASRILRVVISTPRSAVSMPSAAQRLRAPPAARRCRRRGRPARSRPARRYRRAKPRAAQLQAREQAAHRAADHDGAPSCRRLFRAILAVPACAILCQQPLEECHGSDHAGQEGRRTRTAASGRPRSRPSSSAKAASTTAASAASCCRRPTRSASGSSGCSPASGSASTATC